MFTAFALLCVLVGATPAVAILDGPIVHALLMATSAAGISLVAGSIRPGEAGHLLTTIRPAAVAAAVPALWMLTQLLPLQLVGLSHPIWDAAAAALGKSIGGSISIDPGATLICLGRYLCVAGIVFVAAAVTIDRRRADWVLFALTGAAAVIALVLLFHNLAGAGVPGEPAGGTAEIAAIDCVALGVVFSATCGIRAFERSETRRNQTRRQHIGLAGSLAACCLCFVVDGVAVAWNATTPLVLAVVYGLASLAAVVAIRRLGLGPWTWSAMAASALVGAMAVILIDRGIRASDATLALAGGASESLTAIAARILAETPWAGTGAGTFTAVVPIYRDAGDVVIRESAPTAAAALAIELGRPALWLSAVMALAIVAAFWRAALRRGRDSFYPAAGGAAVLVLTMLSFANAGIFNTAVQILAAAMLGLALAQSRSRADR